MGQNRIPGRRARFAKFYADIETSVGFGQCRIGSAGHSAWPNRDFTVEPGLGPEPAARGFAQAQCRQGSDYPGPDRPVRLGCRQRRRWLGRCNARQGFGRKRLGCRWDRLRLRRSSFACWRRDFRTRRDSSCGPRGLGWRRTRICRGGWIRAGRIGCSGCRRWRRRRGGWRWWRRWRGRRRRGRFGFGGQQVLDRADNLFGRNLWRCLRIGGARRDIVGAGTRCIGL